MANANTGRVFAGPPPPLILLPPEQHPDERLRTDLLGPVVDAIPVPQLKDNAPPGTPLITGVPSVNNNLLTMATLSQLVPNIKIRQVHQSIKQILLHHNHRVVGSRRISQSVAALHAIKEYLTIAALKIPKSILEDAREKTLLLIHSVTNLMLPQPCRTDTKDNETFSEHNVTDLPLSKQIYQPNSLLQLQNGMLQLQKGMLHLVAETTKDTLKLSQNSDRRMIDYKILLRICKDSLRN
jgi:hypothetical protein